VNSRNLVAFPAVMDFLDKNDGKRPSAENECIPIIKDPSRQTKNNKSFTST
jgi:hypothetical protein